jgi:hypothetical protein
MRLLAAALVLLLAAPVRAEPVGAEPVSGAEFRAFAEGWTLWFERDGRFFGAEQYLAGDRARWRFGTGGCEDGWWIEREGAICFAYETNPNLQCWMVTRRDGTLFARSVDDPEGADELRVFRRDRAPLDCPGPSTGV